MTHRALVPILVVSLAFGGPAMAGPTDPPTAEEAPFDPSPLLTWGGAALAVVGLGLLVGGAVSGVQSNAAFDAVGAPANTAQIIAVREHERGNDLAAQANALYGAGSATAGVGLGLLIWGLASQPEPQLEASAATDAPATVEVVHVAAPARQTFTIKGGVFDAGTGEPVADASVFFEGFEVSPLRPDPQTGEFTSFPLESREGLIRVVAEAPGYARADAVVTRGEAGAVVKVNIQLNPADTQTVAVVRGALIDGRRGKPLPGQFFIPSIDLRRDIDAQGKFVIDVPPGHYDVLISSPGFVTQRKKLKLAPGETVILNLDMVRDAR